MSIYTNSQEHNSIKLVAIYNIQLHVSALYVEHHQVVQRTYEVTTQCVW